MTNNDALRRIRYALDLSDDKMIKIFSLAGQEVDRATVSSYLKKDEDADFKTIGNPMFLTFFEGLIILRRGRSDAQAKEIKEKVTNNLILKKLKIAMDFKSEDMHEVFELAEMEISKSELSALFRGTDHRNYKECGDKFLRNFLKGLAIKCKESAKEAE